MKKAFTVVELLIVITVIGILAGLTLVAYSGLTSKSSTASLQSDLTNNAKKLKLYAAQYGSYPTGIDGTTSCPTGPTATPGDPTYCLVKSGSNTISSYTGSSTIFTLKMSSGSTSYQINELANPVPATIVDGSYIQNITSANCPAARTRAVDARDNHTYWVQKIADGKCWMLTNLGYAGGGTNTYGDVDTLTNGTGGSITNTVASYYVVPSTTNYTTEPTAPSTSTDGTGQYGYLYNWCGAMGGQATAACASATTPTPDPTVSVCPFGWRLPTNGPNGEVSALNKTINGGFANNSTDSGLRNTWLAQYGGIWDSGFSSQGSAGTYWSSTQASYANAYDSFVSSTYVSAYSGGNGKYKGEALRCVTN